ncbi:MAG: C-GCAxxG-C-C family protein [Ignavibacteriaceae bacterium]
MINKADIAAQKFFAGFNCAQSVLFACSGETKMDEETALKAACGFGAGMGRKQEICGAVTGGIIAIGAKYGKGKNDDQSAVETTYAKTKELMDKFQTEFGTCSCLELLDGCNLMTEPGRKYFSDNDLKNKTCKKCVEKVMHILEDIL